MNDFTHVILDDVLERDQETDFCLLLVKMLQRYNSKAVKIVLMTATGDLKKLASYFEQKFPDERHEVPHPVPILKVKGLKHRIQYLYLDDLLELGQVIFYFKILCFFYRTVFY